MGMGGRWWRRRFRRPGSPRRLGGASASAWFTSSVRSSKKTRFTCLKARAKAEMRPAPIGLSAGSKLITAVFGGSTPVHPDTSQKM
eukprot:298765-Pyramimonas_sp.AAC.1